MNNTKNVNRNASIELLRIICITGIVYMHVYGAIYSSAIGANRVLGVAVNTLFNVGVSCFFLISGFYGIKYSMKKLISMHGLILLYSIIGFIVVSVCFQEFIFKDFVKSILPVVSKKYWFLTCYFIIFIFSDYINLAVDKLGKKKMGKMLLLLLIVFSVLPTFFYFEITGDNGKGIVNAIIMYLIGRYIHQYMPIIKKTKKLYINLIIIYFITFLLNLFTTIIKADSGLFCPFARDNSIFIIMMAIIIFLIFNRIQFQNNTINKIASNSIAVYLLEGVFRRFLSAYNLINVHSTDWNLSFLILAYTLLIVIICILINEVRKILFKKIDTIYTDFIAYLINKVIEKVGFIWQEK